MELPLQQSAAIPRAVERSCYAKRNRCPDRTGERSVDAAGGSCRRSGSTVFRGCLASAESAKEMACNHLYIHDSSSLLHDTECAGECLARNCNELARAHVEHVGLV